MTLTQAKKNTIKAALQAAIAFNDTYYMFAPKANGPSLDYNEGNLPLNEKRAGTAYNLVTKLDNKRL